MKILGHVATLAVALAVTATAAAAQHADSTQRTTMRAHATTHSTAHHVTGSKAMRAEAKIGEDSATSIALAQVPGGTLRSGELEREHGRLIYSFDIKVAGTSGIEEVNVDARDGSVVAHEHEGPAAEARERAQEAKERGTKTKAARKPLR